MRSGVANLTYWCSETNILTMDHKLLLQNAASAAVYTLLNTLNGPGT